MDSSQIESLCYEIGMDAAEDMVCRAMEDVAMRLCQIQRLARSGARDDLYREVRRLCAVADQIGLVSVAQTGRDVLGRIEWQDKVAEAACLERLGRVGESSLAALWDLQDLSV